MSLFQRLRAPFSDRVEEDFVPSGPSSPIVGALLRERREELGLDLDAVGEALRIRPIYLAALEEGRAQDLPGPAYALGFLRAYAQHLGLDGERVVERFRAESTEIHARPDLTLPVPLGERSLPGGPILLVGVILALLGYGTWYYLATGERSRPERVAAVPAELRQAAQAIKAAPLAAVPPGPQAPSSRSDAASAAPQLSTGLVSPQNPSPPPSPPAGVPNPGRSTVPAAAASAPPTAAPATASNAPVAGSNAPGTPSAAAPPSDTAAKPVTGIEIRALADVWIQVRAGDTQAIVFSRVLKAGGTYRVPRPGLLLRTGNAGALAIVVDGKPAPSIGAIGVLRRNVTLEPAALLAGTAVRG